MACRLSCWTCAWPGELFIADWNFACSIQILVWNMQSVNQHWTVVHIDCWCTLSANALVDGKATLSCIVVMFANLMCDFDWMWLRMSGAPWWAMLTVLSQTLHLTLEGQQQWMATSSSIPCWNGLVLVSAQELWRLYTYFSHLRRMGGCCSICICVCTSRVSVCLQLQHQSGRDQTQHVGVATPCLIDLALSLANNIII